MEDLTVRERIKRDCLHQAIKYLSLALCRTDSDIEMEKIQASMSEIRILIGNVELSVLK